MKETPGQIQTFNMRIATKKNLHGGGNFLRHYFTKYLYGQKDLHILDWCSGCGHIGFDLLNNSIASKVVFFDKSQEAIDLVGKTITANNLSISATALVGSSLAEVEHERQFDVIVGNPPHFNVIANQASYLSSDAERHIKLIVDQPNLWYDEGWQAHHDLFLNLDGLLSDNGFALLIENTHGSNIDTFRVVAERSNICLESSVADDNFWFLKLTRAN